MNFNDAKPGMLVHNRINTNDNRVCTNVIYLYENKKIFLYTEEVMMYISKQHINTMVKTNFLIGAKHVHNITSSKLYQRFLWDYLEEL
jgi:hypothetical protein